MLSATLPSGERIQFVIPPAVPRGTVSITVRKPSHLIKRLDDFEREGLFERTATVTRTSNADLLPFERELVELKDAGRYAEFLRLAVRKHQTIVVSGKTGSGKTTFMKGLVEEVPKHERLITIQDTAELTLPNHPNVVHLFYSKDAQGTARVTAKSLLEACLRMRPDRIFLAEVRGDECFSFIRLAASGHPGSITSVHAGSCALAFEQMALMIRESGAGGGLNLQEIKGLLKKGDIVQIVDNALAGIPLSADLTTDSIVESAKGVSNTPADYAAFVEKARSLRNTEFEVILRLRQIRHDSVKTRENFIKFNFNTFIIF